MAVVYAKKDDLRRILEVHSSVFLTDSENWEAIDEGEGDRYEHAQSNYLPLGLLDEQGHYNYKLVDGKVLERTENDKLADPVSTPLPSLEAEIERLKPYEEGYKILVGEGDVQ